MKRITALIVAAMLPASAADAQAPVVAKKGSAVAGKTLFLAKCATCHGKDATGIPSMAKLFKVDRQNMNYASPQNVKLSDAELAVVIMKGNGKMPSFKGKLKDDDVANLVAFIRSVQSSAK